MASLPIDQVSQKLNATQEDLQVMVNYAKVREPHTPMATSQLSDDITEHHPWYLLLTIACHFSMAYHIINNGLLLMMACY